MFFTTRSPSGSPFVMFCVVAPKLSAVSAASSLVSASASSLTSYRTHSQLLPSTSASGSVNRMSSELFAPKSVTAATVLAVLVASSLSPVLNTVTLFTAFFAPLRSNVIPWSLSSPWSPSALTLRLMMSKPLAPAAATSVESWFTTASLKASGLLSYSATSASKPSPVYEEASVLGLKTTVSAPSAAVERKIFLGPTDAASWLSSFQSNLPCLSVPL